MINWDATYDQFGYTTDCLNVYRPKVICNCDVCGKEKVITIRVKSKVVDNQMAWKCHACVGSSVACHLSQTTAQCWRDGTYRHNQLRIKRSDDYLKHQADLSSKRWEDPEYRGKFPNPAEKVVAYIARCNLKFNGQFDYTDVYFNSWQDKINITCKNCDYNFSVSADKHLSSGYCARCNVSHPQRQIDDYVRMLGYTTILNDRSAIAPLEIDVYVPELKFGIEHHGYYWHSHNTPETLDQKNYHQRKALLAIENNVTLKQFYCFEWLNNNALIKSMVDHYLGKSLRIYARDCAVVELTEASARDFFNSNHLQSHRPARHYLALVANDTIVAAVSISLARDGHELIRMAFASGHTVVGGASRLISRAMKKWNIIKLFTFADLRYSTGAVYKRLGFQELYVTRPNYKYVTKNLVMSRQRCQKHKLPGLLGTLFNPDWTEAQNMFNAGYRRLWDAGNIKMVKYGK